MLVDQNCAYKSINSQREEKGLWIFHWKMPDATAEAFRGGWFHTGDMATVDEDGYVFIMDRKKDMIISGGFNIYPREVEDVLMSHQGVTEAAVIGVPDDVWGESVKSFVVMREDITVTEEELIQHCKEILASYKKPKSVEFVEDLPKNAYGKVLRKDLKEPYWKGLDRRIQGNGNSSPQRHRGRRGFF